MTALIISNKEMWDILNIVKCVKESDLLNIGVSKTIENEVKEQKSAFLDMLVATLGATLLANMLASKVKIPGQGLIRAGEKIIKAGQDFWYCLIFWLILKWNNIKANLNLMVVIQKMINLK